MRASLSRFAVTSKLFLSSSPSRPLQPLISSRLYHKMSSTAHSVLKQTVKLALIQLIPSTDKEANLRATAEKVAKAASSGAKIVVLPECFNSPYGPKYFPQYAETLLPSPPSKEQAPSYHALSAMAADNQIYLVGGSIPEYNTDTKKFHNTCLIFGPDGKLLDTFRKIHLFDIDIPGKITFKESDSLSPGNKISIVDLPEYGKIAIGICYDVRFPELATIAARKGAFALIYPGAFNLTTGPMHWKLLGQARAMDNQLYVALCSQARDMDADYHAWGHSLIVDPLAQVVDEADEHEGIVEWVLEGEKIDETRRNIPLNTQRRFDVYPDVSAGNPALQETKLQEP